MAKQNWKPGNMLYPLPAVMVSCQSSAAHDPLCERPELDGKPNIITVAWAGTVCTNPPMVSISVRPERYSYHLIEESGEFVINLTTEKLVKATDYCGVRSGRDGDKFKEMHLTPLASKHIHAPGIAESPVNIVYYNNESGSLSTPVRMFLVLTVLSLAPSSCGTRQPTPDRCRGWKRSWPSSAPVRSA